jgi:diguanylate cyclase (GGDEF)-like protein
MNANDFFRGYLLASARLIAVSLDRDLHVRAISPGCVQALGFPPDALVGRKIYELLIADDRDTHYNLEKVDNFTNEIINVRSQSGRKVPVYASFFREEDGALLVGEVLESGVRSQDALLEVHKKSFSLAKTVEELEQKIQNLDMVNQWLRDKAVTDPHTGLYKRNHLDKMLGAEWERAKRFMGDLSFMLVNVDGLRAFREVQGSEAGTRVIRGVARVLDGRRRLYDIFGNFDTETFFLILPHTEIQGALDFGSRLVKLLENREIRASGYPFSITLSAGVASYHHRRYPLKNHEELLHHAVDFLSEAQLAGGNQVVNRQSPMANLRAAIP